MGCACSKQQETVDTKENKLSNSVVLTSEQEQDKPHTSAAKKKQDGEVFISADQFNVENKGVLRDFYKLGKVLGSGGFGEVRQAVHILTGEIRAVKIINKESVEDPSIFYKEVSILHQCDHPNILRVFEFFQDNKKYYLVSEFLTGGELFDKISKEISFSEQQAANFMKQIMSAVNYCHSKSIVHRDLKPENLLLENDKPNSQLKIIDFGTSTCMDQNKKLEETFGTLLKS